MLRTGFDRLRMLVGLPPRAKYTLKVKPLLSTTG
jgi:hypothetical protein